MSIVAKLAERPIDGEVRRRISGRTFCERHEWVIFAFAFVRRVGLSKIFSDSLALWSHLNNLRASTFYLLLPPDRINI